MDSKSASLSHMRSQNASREVIRPFVCGTFRDFHAERDFLNDHVFPKLHRLCQERGTSFLPVDLRWDSKQGQSASDHILRVCLDNVERCAPYFICLLGDRYGVHRPSESEPPDVATEEWLTKNYELATSHGYEWLKEDEYRCSSLTELEVVQASFRKKYDYGYFYFRDPEHLKEKIDSADSEEEKEILLSNHKIESEYSAKKLRELKQQVIDTELPVRHFRTLEELGDLVLADWTSVINTLYSPIEPFVFSNTNTEPFRQWSLHETVSESYRRTFIRTPRTREISDVLSVHAEVEQGVTRKTSVALSHVMLSTFMTSVPGGDSLPPILTLLGERGSGKSALVSYWLKQFTTARPEVVLVPHHVGCDSSSADVTNFMRRCTRELRTQYLGSDLNDIIDNNDITDFRRVTEAFHAAIELGPSVIVLDGASEFGKSHDLPAYQAKELTWLPKEIPEFCRLIITTIKSDITYRALKQRKDSYFIELNNVLDAKSKRKLLEEYVGANYTNFMDEQHYAKILSSKLSELPMYYVALASELRILGTVKNPERQLDMYVHATSVGELWKQIIRRWTHDYGWLRPAASRNPVPSIKAQGSRDRMNSGWVADAMRLFSVSRSGLTEREMLGALRIMGYANNYSISTAYWSMLRIAAQNALLELPSGALIFSHGVIRNAVDVALLSNLTSPSHERVITPMSDPWERQKQQCHVVLGKYFAMQPNSPRIVEELPWQQLISGNLEELCRTITNPGLFVYFAHNRNETQRQLDFLCYWKALKSRGHKPEVVLLQMAESAKERLSQEHLRAASSVSRVEEPLIVETVCYKTEEDPLSPMELTVVLYHAGKYLMHCGDLEAAERLLLAAYKTGNPVASVLDLELMCHVQCALGDMYVAMETMSTAANWYTGALKTSSEITCREHEATIGGILCKLAMTRMDGENVPVGPSEERPKSRVPSRSSRSRTTSGHSRPDNDSDPHIDSSVGPLLKEAFKHLQLAGSFPVTSTAFYYMGLQSMKQQQWSEARKALETAMLMRKQWYGRTHPSVARIVDLLGTLCWNDTSESREISESEKLYREALHMREEALGKTHLEVASTLFKLGKLLRVKNTKDATREAKQLFQRSLDIRTAKLGVYHSATKTVRRELMGLEMADVALTFGTSAAIKEQPMLMLRDYKAQLLAKSASSKLASRN
ncbi:tetratricopeptide repeat protein 41 isoform X2 [Nematostella vectensis]|uniref:tetratricopeptide repeat protein 41 isoform X2 n=1 Tax=Nematostella vectensis TaxID=45351 RepID=UPI00138FB5B0|nr:tetratricopeptide repeat protein 41 isoform X2 [Nematostella vectensis]